MDEDAVLVFHFLESRRRHAEKSDLVDRTVTVFEGAQYPVLAGEVPFEVEHGVDDVLEDLRPGDRSFLRYVADQKHGDVRALRDVGETRSRFAHLGDRACHAGDLGRGYRLDRVDEDADRFDLFHELADLVGGRVGRHMDLGKVDAEPFAAVTYLHRGLFAGDVERTERTGRLQRKGGLPDPRFSADENDAAGYYPSAADQVEFGRRGHDAFEAGVLYIGKPCRFDLAAAFALLQRLRLRRAFGYRVP